VKTFNLSAVLALEAVVRVGMLAVILQAEYFSGNIMDRAPATIEYYYWALGVSLTFFGLLFFAVKTPLVRDLRELCLWDAFPPVVAIIMFHSGSPATRTVFFSLGTTILFAKAMRILWPVTAVQDGPIGWPPFGVLGWLGGSRWVALPAPRWHQRRWFIYLCLSASLPLGYWLQAFTVATKVAPITITLFLVTLFGLRPLVGALRKLEAERQEAILRAQTAQAELTRLEAERATQLEAISNERQAMLADLHQRNQRILHANHDIMQPVFWLNSVLQQALQQAATPAARDLLGKAHLAAQEISSMLSDVFYQVNQEANQAAPVQQVLPVTDLSQYCWDRFFDLATRQQVRLVMGNEAFSILANEPRLRRVLANLLNNAILYAGPGQTVSLRFYRRYGRCHIFVRNSGTGIADANQADRAANTTHLLARITAAQADAGGPLASAAGLGLGLGHGIGLPSTARLCAEMGSILLLRSRPGHGCVFSFSVALAQ
jgi:signal transduction histidine kinase